MDRIQIEILDNISYKGLDYESINKKLNTNLSNDEIEDLIVSIIMNKESFIIDRDEKYYVADNKNELEVIINMSSYIVIDLNKI